MGYGGLPNFTEYDPSGHVLLDGTLGKNVQNFRTYLSPWSGQPPGLPVGWRAAGAGTVAVGELERRHERRLLAGAGGRLAERARTGRERAEDGFPDDDLRCRRAPPTWPCRRSTARGAVHRHLGARSRVERAAPVRRRCVAMVRRCRWPLRARAGGGCSSRLGGAPPSRRGHRRPQRSRRHSPSLRAAGLNVSAALAGARVTVSPGPGSQGRLHHRRSACSASPLASSRTSSSWARAAAHTPVVCSPTRRATAPASCRSRPFDDGELVTVHARAARSRQGDPVRVELHRRRARQPGGGERDRQARRTSSGAGAGAEGIPELSLAPGTAPAGS